MVTTAVETARLAEVEMIVRYNSSVELAHLAANQLMWQVFK